MIKNHFQRIKGCSREDLLNFRGQFHFPIERAAVLSCLMKFPGSTVDKLREHLDIEKSIISDVVAELYDSGKIHIDISGRVFLANSGGL